MVVCAGVDGGCGGSTASVWCCYWCLVVVFVVAVCVWVVMVVFGTGSACAVAVAVAIGVDDHEHDFVGAGGDMVFGKYGCVFMAGGVSVLVMLVCC